MCKRIAVKVADINFMYWIRRLLDFFVRAGGQAWTGGQRCDKVDIGIVATFHRQCAKNSTVHTERIVCPRANFWVGIVRISLRTLRPCTPKRRKVHPHSFPYPKFFKRHTVPRQSRGKKNHHLLKLSICYRTSCLGWGGGNLSCKDQKEEESITMS